jgi:hypothetical protein
LLASLSYTFGLLFGKRHVVDLMGADMFTLVVLQTALAGVQSTVLSLTIEFSRDKYRGVSALHDSECFADVALGLGGITVITFLLYFYMIKTIGPLKTSYVFYIIPVIGIAESAAFEQSWEHVSRASRAGGFIGVVIVLVAVWMLTTQPKFLKHADCGARTRTRTRTREGSHESANGNGNGAQTESLLHSEAPSAGRMNSRPQTHPNPSDTGMPDFSSYDPDDR